MQELNLLLKRRVNRPRVYNADLVHQTLQIHEAEQNHRPDSCSTVLHEW